MSGGGRKAQPTTTPAQSGEPLRTQVSTTQVSTEGAEAAKATFGAVIAQIVAIDIVFSVDSILTAVGMTDEIPIMVMAVVITVGIMMVAADPLARFIEKNPTLVMLALAFLVMIGLVLIADGFGFHVPKGYIYAAMGFSIGVELLNIMQRNRRVSRQAAAGGNV